MLRVGFFLTLLLAIAPSAATAGLIRLSGGSGSPSVLEVLEDSAFVVNTGGDFRGYQIRFIVPNASTQLPGPGVVNAGRWFVTNESAVSVYNANSSTTQYLGTQFDSSNTYVVKSLEFRQQSGNDLTIAVDFPNWSEYHFQPNDVITLRSGTYQLGTDTNGVWVSPGSTYDITASSLSFPTEFGPNYSPSDVTPLGPSAVPEIDPAGLGSVLAVVTGALGLLERRRRKAKTAA